MMDRESEVAHLLHTNNVPTEEQVRQTASITSRFETYVSLLEAKIAAAQADLDNQLRQRSDAQEHLEAHKALLSPARRLPTDIVTEIFFRCLPTDRYPSLSALEAPLLLTGICQ